MSKLNYSGISHQQSYRQPVTQPTEVTRANDSNTSITTVISRAVQMKTAAAASNTTKQNWDAPLDSQKGHEKDQCTWWATVATTNYHVCSDWLELEAPLKSSLNRRTETEGLRYSSLRRNMLKGFR